MCIILKFVEKDMDSSFLRRVMNFLKTKNKHPVRKKQNDVDLIQELSNFLKEHGDKILNGDVLFSLNTTSLACVNEGLSKVTEEQNNISFEVVQISNTSLTVLHELNFLYDFIQKISALKMVHGNATLQGRVNISRFRNLKMMEIKKIPIHLVLGLQNLRPRLESIKCHRSIQNLEGLFVKCGGDMAQEFTWNQLKLVDLSYNGIEDIDDSFKLIPFLEVLNLSHNNLKMAKNLTYPTVLKHLSLAYNCLYEIPTLSASSRGTLNSLNLSYNNLESLKGIGELYALEDLDVSGNCLTDHSTLQRIMMLKNLKSLNLVENPLSYHKMHRDLTLKFLHPETSDNKFTLDGKLLSKFEKTLIKEVKIFSISDRVLNAESYARNGDDNISVASSIQCEPSGSSIPRKVTDIQSSLEYSYSPSIRRRNKKSSKIVDAVILDPSNLDTPDDGASSNGNSEKPEEFLDIKAKIQKAREKFGADWLVAGQKNVVPVTKYEPELFSSRNFTKNGSLNDGNISEVNVTQENQNTSKLDAEKSPNLYDDNNASNDIAAPKEDLTIDSGTYYIVLTDCYDSDSPIIVSISSRSLTEKDSMSGKIIDTLDLHSLVRYKLTCEEEKCIFSIKLIFDYVKKSRQEKKYFFEDDSQLSDFKEQIDPYIAARNLKALVNNGQQCLKCCAEFTKNSALNIVKTVENTPEEFSGRPSSYKGQKGYLVEVSVCPNCKSEMIVEMDTYNENIPKRQTSTPLLSSTPRASVLSDDPNLDVNENARQLFKDESTQDQGQTVNKILKDDAVVYSGNIANKVEIEVEAEVYNSSISQTQSAKSDSYEEENMVKECKISRNDSDISILSNPSQSSIAVLSAKPSDDFPYPECDSYENADFSVTNVEAQQLHFELVRKLLPIVAHNNSHSGESLSGSVCTQLETNGVTEPEVVENEDQSEIVDSNGHAGEDSLSQSQVLVQKDDPNSSFTDLDYRVKLYLSMSLFGKDEDFRGYINAGVMNYQKLQEFPAMILLTNNSVYILKLTGEMNVDEPHSYLQKIDSKDFISLKYITLLFGNQGIQLEFLHKGKQTIYKVLIRDSEKCTQFMSLFVEILNECSSDAAFIIPLISASTKDMLQRIEIDLNLTNKAQDESAITLYIMGYLSTKGEALTCATFIFTATDIYATEENHEWPVPSILENPESKDKRQFRVLDQEKIMNLTEIECNPSLDDRKCTLNFLNEDTMVETSWSVSLETIYSLNAFIRSIRTPWEELFGVELNMSITTILDS